MGKRQRSLFAGTVFVAMAALLPAPAAAEAEPEPAPAPEPADTRTAAPPGAGSEPADTGASTTPEPRDKPATSWRPTVEVTANGTEMVVSRVPLEIRDVPVKLWSPSFEQNTAIPGERYTILPVVGLNVLMNKPRLKLGKARVRAGLRWVLLPFAWSGKGNTRRFDAATTPDGLRYGHLTTCYAIAPRGMLPGWAWRDPLWTATYGNEESGPGVGFLYFLLNFAPCVQAEVPLVPSGRVNFQASVSYYRLEAMSGWLMASDPGDGPTSPGFGDTDDDEDWSQTYRRDTLAHCFPVTAAVQFRSVSVGARYLMFTPTHIGRRSGLAPRRFSGFLSFSY